MQDLAGEVTHTRLHFVHWLVLGASLLLTILAWYISSNQQQQKHAKMFEVEAERLSTQLRERMEKYENALWSGVGALEIIKRSRGLTRPDWRRFAQTMNLLERYPGINGIGVIYSAQPEELPRLEDRFAEQFPELERVEIYPKHQHGVHFPILLLEPLDGNREAIGLDIAFEKNRRTAALAALETGTPQMTGPIVLVQDAEETPGFLLFVPFNIPVDGTPEEPRQDRGFVYAPFVVKDLIAGTLASTKRLVTFSLRDSGTNLYAETADNTATFDPAPMFETQTSVQLYGREWIFDIRSNLEFRSRAQSSLPTTILIGGITVDLLLLGVFLILVNSNARAVNLAQKMTADLRESKSQLKKRNEELIQFNYRVSHDLVAPLKTIQGLVLMARDDLSDNNADAVDPSLERVDAMVNQQIQVISSIFELCESDLSNEAYQRIDIRKLAKSLFARVLRVQTEARVELRLPIPEGTTVLAKPTRLEQILFNLISNAVKFRNPNADNPMVEITVERVDSWVTLRVRDNGIGIPANARGRVFDLFFRAHSTHAGGAGLGTYIVRKNVENMGGTARVHSDPDGTLFEIEWPEYPVEVDAA